MRSGSRSSRRTRTRPPWRAASCRSPAARRAGRPWARARRAWRTGPGPQEVDHLLELGPHLLDAGDVVPAHGRVLARVDLLRLDVRHHGDELPRQPAEQAEQDQQAPVDQEAVQPADGRMQEAHGSVQPVVQVALVDPVHRIQLQAIRGPGSLHRAVPGIVSAAAGTRGEGSGGGLRHTLLARGRGAVAIGVVAAVVALGGSTGAAGAAGPATCARMRRHARLQRLQPHTESVKPTMVCADPAPPHQRFEDHGHYIGHDEPSLRFLSSRPGSASDVTWVERLPVEPIGCRHCVIPAATSPTPSSSPSRRGSR